METKIINSSTLTYELSGENYSIVVKDNSDNQDFVDIEMGESKISVPKKILYQLISILEKYE